MTQQFIHKFALLDPVGYYLIYRPWLLLEEFKVAQAWIADFRWEEAHWDFGSGSSHVNNVQYPNRVYFANDEDYLMFKLKFPTLLRCE